MKFNLNHLKYFALDYLKEAQTGDNEDAIVWLSSVLDEIQGIELELRKYKTENPLMHQLTLTVIIKEILGK